MKLYRSSAIALLLACAVADQASAQSTPPATPGQSQASPLAIQSAAAPAALCCKVPALTPVELEFVDAPSSRTSKSGDIVAMRLVEPLVVDGHLIAPAGSTARAEVIQASKAGLMSKSGELTFAARYLQVGDVRIPLKRFGYGRNQGKDPSGTVNTLNTAAAVALPIAAVALIFVSGGNVDIKSGARAHAVVATETFVPSNP